MTLASQSDDKWLSRGQGTGTVSISGDGQEDPAACEPQQEGTGAEGTECCVSTNRADLLHASPRPRRNRDHESLREAEDGAALAQHILWFAGRGKKTSRRLLWSWPHGKGQGQVKGWTPETVDCPGGV